MSENSVSNRIRIIQDLIQDKQPQNSLHIGTGDIAITEALCLAVDSVEEALLTIIPTYANTEKPDDDLLRFAEKASQVYAVDFVKIPADKVLPDFYFQQQRIDLVVLQSAPQFDQAQVACYYINKMLTAAGAIVITDCQSPEMKRLCRQLIWEKGYRVKNEGISNKPRLVSQALQFGFSKAPKPLKSKLNEWLHPDLLRMDGVFENADNLLILEKPASEDNDGNGIDYEAQMNMDFDALLETLMKE